MSSGQTPPSSTSSGPSAISALLGEEHDGAGSVASSSSGTSLRQAKYGSPLAETKVVKSSDHRYRTLESRGGERDVRRRSGGFLLHSFPAISSHKPTTRPTSEYIAGTRGKGKSEEDELIIQKRRRAQKGYLLKLLPGSSPLATEVTNINNTDEAGHNGNEHDPDDIPSIPSTFSNKSSYTAASNTVGNGTRVQDELKHVQQRNQIGNDTDPAQIVNLALSLSENRRRNITPGRLGQPDPGGNKRHTSDSQLRNGNPNRPSPGFVGGSIRQHLQQQRHISRNVSPRSPKSGIKVGLPQQSRLSGERDGEMQSMVYPSVINSAMDDVAFNPSDATFSRAERARIALELSYEYRRLLQYLPPLIKPQRSRPATADSVASMNSGSARSLGRQYNPLQYIRNRKTRGRERQVFDAEAGGWKDIDRVRQWIDTIARERENGVSRIDDEFPLPPFHTDQRETSEYTGSPASDVHQIDHRRAGSAPRPRNDWVTTPWEFLADAYWLQQDDNKWLIEDSTGRKIYSYYALGEGRSGYNSGSTQFSDRRPESLIKKHSHSRTSRKHLHTKSQPAQPNEKHLDTHSVPRSTRSKFEHLDFKDRKGLWARNLLRSRSLSSSDDSAQSSLGQRKRRDMPFDSREQLESAALEKQMMERLEKEANDGTSTNHDNDHNRTKGRNTALRSHFSNRRSNHRANSQDRNNSRGRAPRRKHNRPASVKIRSSARLSLDEMRGRPSRKSFEDIDSTAPNSPLTPNFVPSIAINLSQPDYSPVSTKSQRLVNAAPLEADLTKQINSIGENDFALQSQTSLPRKLHSSHDAQEEPSQSTESANSSKGLLSPAATNTLRNRLRHSHSKSIRNVKEGKEPDSRLKGFLKGGRIAELVGNEVSKVGDMLRKRDSGHDTSDARSIASGYASEATDTDEELSDLTRSRTDTTASMSAIDGGRVSRRSTNKSEKPRYYTSNLPSFQPFGKKNDASPKSPISSPDDDHITRQQIAQKERPRSSRWNRLAPPKMDMRGISPSSPALSRVKTQDSAASRRDSSQGSLADYRRVQDADRRLSDALGIPFLHGRTGPAMTGLAHLDAHSSRPTLQDKREWSISDHGLSMVHGMVTKQDIARVRALLLSSGVKANEILRRANETRDRASPFLRELEDLLGNQLPRVPRKKEHVLAARLLVRNIDTTNRQIREGAEKFTNELVAELHDRIKAIDESVTTSLTPAVRQCTDEADACGMELTTEKTLAVKRLGEIIDNVIRRRRRRFRWIRRAGWAVLEWMLVGVMWAVWGIVVIIQFLRGVIQGTAQGIRWLVWL